jgi:hypothetical protein
MKKIAYALIALATLVIFSGGFADVADGDENYQDNSNEYSTGPGEAPERGHGKRGAESQIQR